MATYNGEEFLSEQLDSLITQTYKDWELYVSDDSSTDNTIKILQEYRKKEPRIKKILVNKEKHGAYNNYFNVMHYVKYNVSTDFDFYFYCDQDDVWVKDKMEKEIKVISDQKKPALCYSNLELTDSVGNDLNISMCDLTNINLENKYNLFFSGRYIWGTTMAHNRELWDLMFLDKDLNNRFQIAHDSYVGKYAVAFGKCIYLPDKLVLYRRHDNNVSGIPGKYNPIKRMLTKMPEIINNHASIYWEDLYFIKHSPYRNDFLNRLSKCIEKGSFYSWGFLNKFNISTSDSKLSRASIRVILFFKLYKLSKTFQRKII